MVYLISYPHKIHHLTKKKKKKIPTMEIILRSTKEIRELLDKNGALQLKPLNQRFVMVENPTTRQQIPSSLVRFADGSHWNIGNPATGEEFTPTDYATFLLMLGLDSDLNPLQPNTSTN